MKICIDAEEHYPVFAPWVPKDPERYPAEIEITEEEWLDYLRVEREFNEWQLKLRELIKWD